MTNAPEEYSLKQLLEKRLAGEFVSNDEGETLTDAMLRKKKQRVEQIALFSDVMASTEMLDAAEYYQDRAALIAHRLIARNIFRNSDALAEARGWLKQYEESCGCEQEWSDLLSQQVPTVCRRLCERSDEMYGLRRSSPFLEVDGPEEPARQLRIQMKARQCPLFVVGFEDREWLPAFQFEAQTRRVLPGVKSILELKPSKWSAVRLLDWFTRPHVEFGASPSEVVGERAEEVLAAFLRAIAAKRQG